MNIKTFSTPISSTQKTTESDKIKDLKTQASADRDGDGRREQQDESPQKESFSEEELQELVKKIKKTPGFDQHNLMVKVKSDTVMPVIYVEDVDGNVIHRMTAKDAWSMEQKRDSTGKLLNKSA